MSTPCQSNYGSHLFFGHSSSAKILFLEDMAMKTTTLVLSDDYDRIMINKNGRHRSNEFIGCGTLLSSLLQLDYVIISKVVNLYRFPDPNLRLDDIIGIEEEIDFLHDPRYRPVNYHQVFKILDAYHPVIGFLYTEDDWDDIIYDHYAELCGDIIYESRAQENIRLAKEIIDASMSIPSSELYDFYLYLCECGLMQPSPIDPPFFGYSFTERRRYPVPENSTYDNYLTLIYQDYQTLPRKTKTQQAFYTFSDSQTTAEEDHFRFILSACIMELARRKKAIRKCEICGSYFVPAHRSDTKYCSLPCPLEENLTCKEYGARRLAYQRQQADELRKKAKRVSNDKRKLIGRSGGEEVFVLGQKYFQLENKKWSDAYKRGEKTAEEYSEWLDYMHGNKFVPEAKHYDFDRQAPREPEET